MKTNFKTIFFILVATTFSILSCSKEDDTTSSDLKSTDVYIVGITRNTSNKAIPTIWKNGKPTILPSDNNINTTGFRITVSGNDVYAINGNFDETNAIILWKNGISSVVAENAIAEDLIVENGDVYILGRKGNSFRYWKNGVETILTNGLSNNFVSDMVVVNGDVHITGSENNGSKNVVKYWKNEAATTVSNPSFRAFANGISVNGSDISILFSELTADNTYTLKVWKNGVISTLESGIFNDFSIGRGKIVTTSSGTFVTARLAISNENSKIGFWKNGLKTNLTSGITSSSPFDMKVIEKDIHIIGIERNPGTSGRSVLKYWKNGPETVLTSDAD
ncbi:hypothetical protein DMB65_21055 [Flavobacterium cheongpyeongense]|uniref:Uncharacterized protein n=1 Tax=Flavobacterium cheongpyeongense TaxID=2212651 RepID=A0A2V4BXV8_9FLAO|nr:hypothetical protein [Flavobacterium cheongpyeongense]PXY38814.1 hypothetical protein DMB65_21055 [Flavobacterium cheongpyeongense]